MRPRSSMGLFNRKTASSPETSTVEPKTESTTSAIATSANPKGKHVLPTYNHNGHLVTRGIHPDGESGRSGKTPFLPNSYQILRNGGTLPPAGSAPHASRVPDFVIADLLLLSLSRLSSDTLRSGCMEKLMYSVQMGQCALALRSYRHRPPFRTSRSSRMDLRYQLHRNGPCSKSCWLRRSRVSSEDAQSGRYTG
jgi:hypothetical protein